MITDLFSHKIHSTAESWEDKLVELAHLFVRFDNSRYNRDDIVEALEKISPRSAYAPRDPSKLRDEISAYPAYLGLYRIERGAGCWILRVSDTAKRFLLSEAPDVGSFLRLQLALFQYPNASGAVYGPKGGMYLQANAAEAKLDLVADNVHLSPLRLICKALQADALSRDMHPTSASVTYDEIYALANHHSVNRTASPDQQYVVRALQMARERAIAAPQRYERRFDLLRHTSMFELFEGGLRLRQAVDTADQEDLLAKFEVLLNVRDQFAGFDGAATRDELEDVIGRGDWGRYFDAINTLPSGAVRVLARDLNEEDAVCNGRSEERALSLQVRPATVPDPAPSTPSAERADPEATRVMRERRNLKHKELLDRVDELLRRLGCEPRFSEHIDLYAEIPADGSLLFEVKSGGAGLLAQVRKGLSQLYEYRFRYRTHIRNDTGLCLLLGDDPNVIDWLVDFLCQDRQVSVCWFDEQGNLRYPAHCAETLGVLNEEGATVA